MTPDRRRREPAGEQGSVEVVEMASGEPVEAQRSDRGQDVALDAASVFAEGARGAVGSMSASQRVSRSRTLPPWLVVACFRSTSATSLLSAL